MRQQYWIGLVVAGTLAWPWPAQSQEVPAHLASARYLLQDVAPENNSYQYRGWIRFRGDKTPFGQAAVSEVHTDCSGLVGALLARDAPRVMQAFEHQRWKSYPKAENFYAAIAAGDGFMPRKSMEEVEVGDIFAARFVNDRNTGHVMLVDARPRLIETPIEPILPDTRQWEIVVIDSSSAHGTTDTRYRPGGARQTGIGRGSVRVYTDADGRLVGWVMTMAPRTRLRSSGDLAIGKPLP
ncbi:hypothetical protein [Herbaspirillum sp. YR522]|uniref:hypothetical protein n=1 Tax=Herbaspirillum sp. YR522 TaxID=1144342 RepID=UPI00026FBBF4|nr:hypothetical protein [Herbaspirillum sp. YR522]EJN08693.1 hypothetical protein PMI40_01137 [Herbaspirillum sp. YR522]